MSTNKALVASVVAFAALGMVGGCLVVAEGGFGTSGKRANSYVFVPVPQAYIMAGIMFVMSGIAVMWLLQQAKARAWLYVLVFASYVGLCLFVTRAMGQLL
jgi:hypothetical protein